MTTLVDVRGRYVYADGSPASGTVLFTLSATLQDAAGNDVIVPARMTVDLDTDGEFTASLAATDAPGLTPTGVTYLVEEKIRGALRTYSIEVPAVAVSTGLDLADLAPAVPGEVLTEYALQVTVADFEARLAAIEPGGSGTGVASVNGRVGAVAGLAEQTDLAAEATARQAADAATAAALGALAPVATSGAYGDLTGRPTLGTAAATNAADYQPADADLTAIAALTTTVYGRAFLALADAAAAKTALALVKADVGLSNVDNTSDASKPVSSAQAAADALKADKLLTTNAQTGTAYTLVLGDASAVVEMNNAASNTLTVPPNSSVAFPVGSVIGVRQYGAGQTTVTPGSGVTIRSRGAALVLHSQYAEAVLVKRATDEWMLTGDVRA
jgi:hypothetical protein